MIRTSAPPSVAAAIIAPSDNTPSSRCVDRTAVRSASPRNAPTSTHQPAVVSRDFTVSIRRKPYQRDRNACTAARSLAQM